MYRIVLLTTGLCLSCGPETDPGPAADSDDTGAVAPQTLDFDRWAGGCYTVRSGDAWLAASGDTYTMSATDAQDASRFTMASSDLGTYLFYDEEAGYLVDGDGTIDRQTTLKSDMSELDHTYISGAEWLLEAAVDGQHYQLRSRRNGALLALDGLTSAAADAAPVTFEPATDCAAPPEMSLDAAGDVTMTTFPDGDLYGVVDAHSHLFTHLSFGGWAFHGAIYHRLGPEHALLDCDHIHGEEGRKDFFGYAFDNGNSTEVLTNMVFDMLGGVLSEPNHATDGYPTFSEWPNARTRATHQQQHYRWLERAYLGGLRLVVNHATSNAAICIINIGEDIQPSRYDCEDMTSVDHIIDDTYQMERYIDAQHGGPGQGWFRVVTSPAEARAVIADGKLAVILGIETSDLFSCHITPRSGQPYCDDAFIDAQLDAYYERGVRALFPVHKYDNQFSPGDGSNSFIELGNFMNSGHWTNKTTDCPTDDSMPHGFDNGRISFSGLLEPRDEFVSTPPNDFSNILDSPVFTLLGYASKLTEPSLSGDYCQNATITPVGEHLITGMMERGMIIEVDHFPQWSYQRVYEMLEESDYPAAGTHGRDWEGRLYELGGISTFKMSRCQDPERPGSMSDNLLAEADLMEASGAYPAPSLGFDLNGFAGVPGPRFGENGCSAEQDTPITYPFTAYAGDITFTEPFVGERPIDFNTEGMIHIGLLPELIEDARSDAVSETDLDPLFRSAEGYIRMWERAEARAAELRGE